ncbi:MAG TPA: sulfatase-like hydrolase/transferase, partial [Gammaproteobacteria bacterium]|nr:sulfatase-like hydrolase/transferase [Gammaproteobacteria bacterium]
MCIAFGACYLLEVLLALWLWRVFSKPGYRRTRRVVFSVVMANLVIVYLSFGLAIAGHAWPQGYRYAILRVGRLSPYLSEIYLHFFEQKKPVRNLAVNHQAVPVVIHDILRKLDYPKHPMIPAVGASKMNIVIIAIDTWRFTAMNSVVSPNIYRFAAKTTQFNQHFSGGNCTQPGLFSLFYGLPPNYWQAFLLQHQSPVLMQTLEQSGYNLGIFLSAPISFPQFDKTIFSDVIRLTTRTMGDSSIARDEKITQNFLTFLKQQNAKKPFFSFLFYDAVHNYCEPAQPVDNPFLPVIASCDRFSLDETTLPEPYLNLYNNKVFFVDQQVGRVLHALEKNHHLDDTI